MQEKIAHSRGLTSRSALGSGNHKRSKQQRQKVRRLEQGGKVWRTLSTQVEMLHILETTVKYLFQSISLVSVHKENSGDPSHKCRKHSTNEPTLGNQQHTAKVGPKMSTYSKNVGQNL